MSGTIYDSTNDIPDRPHPNCKCWIDILEKESDEPITDPIESHRERIKEKKLKELELAKLLGDAKSLEQEIDEYIYRIDSRDKELERLEKSIDTNKLNHKDKQKISEVKENIDYAKYKGDKAKQDVTAFKTEISKTGGSIQEISKLMFEFEKLKDLTEKMITEAKLKILTLGIDFIGIKQHDASALWNISVDGPQYDNKYIKENGKICNTVGEINNYKLEKTVQEKIQKQMGVKESRGIIFHKESSLSKAIKNSDEIKKFVIDNKTTLIKSGKLENKSIGFKSGNLKNALHNVDIVDTHIDSNGNLHAKVLDTYDFNPNEKDWKVQTAREMQEKGKIQTYYTITEIVIPKNEWQNF